MGLKTFKGGANIPHYKHTAESGISCVDPGNIVKIPLRQHIGAAAKPVVKAGELVKKGQLIAEAAGLVSANIHSSVSGKVMKISDLEILGMQHSVIEIQNDGLYEWDESVTPKGTLETLSSEELLGYLRESGIVGMGGAGFPTHVKYMPPKDKPVDMLVINGAECEPFLTTDHRLMLEYPDDFIIGVRLFMKILDIKKAIIGIEENKKDAIDLLRSKVQGSDIEIVELKAKYPQGAEKQLIYACTGRTVPAGSLPLEVGVIVNNVATAKAFKDYIYEGKPLVERVVTFAGSSIENPGNYSIALGTMLTDVTQQCGGVKESLEKLILGGPMMGNASPSLEVPITKTTSGILFFNKEEARIKQTLPCIKCSRCLTVCPMRLQPLFIAASSEYGLFEKAGQYHALDCIECGACSFICPSKRPLVHSIRVAKQRLLERH